MAAIIKTEYGYAVEQAGVMLPIEKIVDGGKTLKLPANESNRQYYSIANFEKSQVGGRLELTYKPSITIEKTGDTQPRTVKPLEDWLEGDDRAMYLALKEKAQKNRDAANTKAPMTELEKAQRAVERSQRALEKLLAEGVK